MQVAADTGQILDNGDVELLQLVARANTGQLEDLGGVEGTAGDDDLAARRHGARGAVILARAGAGVGAVQALAVQVVDAGGLGLVARGVKVDLGDQGVEGDVQLVLLGAIGVLGIGNLVDQVAGRRSVIIIAVHSKRQLRQHRLAVAVGRIVVDINEEELKCRKSCQLRGPVLGREGGLTELRPSARLVSLSRGRILSKR